MERRFCQVQNTRRICGNRTHGTRTEWDGTWWESQHPGSRGNTIGSHLSLGTWHAWEQPEPEEILLRGEGFSASLLFCPDFFTSTLTLRSLLRLLPRHFNSLPYVTTVYDVRWPPPSFPIALWTHTYTPTSKDKIYIFLMFPPANLVVKPTRTNTESIICFYIFAVYIQSVNSYVLCKVYSINCFTYTYLFLLRKH